MKKQIKILRNIFFIVLCLIIYISGWKWTQIANYAIESSYVSTQQLDSLYFWRNCFDYLFIIGFIAYFINLKCVALSEKKKYLKESEEIRWVAEKNGVDLIDIAKKLKAEGIDDEIISKCLGIPLDEVRLYE